MNYGLFSMMHECRVMAGGRMRPLVTSTPILVPSSTVTKNQNRPLRPETGQYPNLQAFDCCTKGLRANELVRQVSPEIVFSDT
jgi:hypothetical protein